MDLKLGPLCREVERTLGYALAAVDDPRLGGLSVVAVQPAPDASRLAVLVAAAPGASSPEVLSAALAGARGGLRAELARVYKAG